MNFKAGDKVVCTDSSSSYGLLQVGKVYFVEETWESEEVTVVNGIVWYSTRFKLVESNEL